MVSTTESGSKAAERSSKESVSQAGKKGDEL